VSRRPRADVGSFLPHAALGSRRPRAVFGSRRPRAALGSRRPRGAAVLRRPSAALGHVAHAFHEIDGGVELWSPSHVFETVKN
jgi:hypothetical protein